MDTIATFAVVCFGSLFAVLNPLAIVPPFIAMTEANTPSERKHMALRACVIASLVLVTFMLSGAAILDIFGISPAAFQLAGGLVLLRVAFDLLQGGRTLKVTPDERLEGIEKDDISATPLAFPILCGPATIAAGVLLSHQAATWIMTAVLVAVTLTIYVSVWLLLRVTAVHSHRLGETTIKISSRLMGLILIALAIQFMIGGIQQVPPLS